MHRFVNLLYYSLFLIVPLVVVPWTSELFEFNKIIVIYTITLLLIAVHALRTIWYTKQGLTSTPLHKYMFIFLVALALSTLFSIDRHTSIMGYYGRFNGGLLSQGAGVVLFLGAVTYLNRKTFVKMLRYSAVSSVVVMLWGLSGVIGRDLSCLLFTGTWSNSCWTDQFRPAERMFSTLGQPNWLGAYLAVHIFIGFAFFVLAKNEKYRMRWGGYVLLTYLCIWLTHSRSTMLGAIAGAVVVLGLFIVRRGEMVGVVKKIRKELVLLGVGLVVVTILVSINWVSVGRSLNPRKFVASPTAAAVALPSEVTESFDIRKIVWKGAILLGLKHPILGTGPETFAYAYYQVRPREHNLTSEWDFIYNKAHNEYLNYFATTGLLGLGAYLLLIFYIANQFIKVAMHEKNHEVLIITILLTGSWSTLLVTNFFGFSTTTQQLFFFILPAYLYTASLSEKVEEEKAKSSVAKYFATTAVVVGVLIGLISIYSYHQADTKYAQATTYIQLGEYHKALPLLTSALNLHYEHVYEDKLSSVYSQLALLSAYSGEAEAASQSIALSDKYNKNSIKASPQNPFYFRTKSKNEFIVYQMTQSQDDLRASIESLAVAQSLAPTDPKLLYTQALFYYQWGLDNREDSSFEKDKFKQAQTLVNRALELKSNYQDAHILRVKLLSKIAPDTFSLKEEREKLKQIFPLLTDDQIDQDLLSLP